MTKTRLEAFSDGVIAIIITIMVLELKTPHGTTWNDIKPLCPSFFSYVLSFIYLGIYWGNHHHLLHTVTHVNTKIIWGNLHLLFWLSLVPFATAWMGENNFEKTTVAAYGTLMSASAVSYYILQRAIVANHHMTASLELAMQKQSRKGIISLIGYLVSIPAAFIYSGISATIFVAIALIWIIPDRNIEKALKE